MSVYSNSDSAEVVLIVVHSVLIIVNIAGNVLVCVIILRNRDMRYADKKKVLDFRGNVTAFLWDKGN